MQKQNPTKNNKRTHIMIQPVLSRFQVQMNISAK